MTKGNETRVFVILISSFFPILRRKWLICIGAIAIFFVIAAALGVGLFFSPVLTHYVESDVFRQTMENETAKGLHFPSGRYLRIRRTGPLTAQSEGFRVTNGQKAMKSIDARGITATFNPWVAIFLPNRVVLRRIESDAANVTWRLRGERAGFFGTRLLITPNGPDFEYRANGGTLKMAVVPNLYLRQAHLLITKTLFTLYDIDLAPNPQSDGSIRGHGNAGIGEDKSVDLRATFERLPIRGWLPAKWKEHL